MLLDLRLKIEHAMETNEQVRRPEKELTKVKVELADAHVLGDRSDVAKG